VRFHDIVAPAQDNRHIPVECYAAGARDGNRDADWAGVCLRPRIAFNIKSARSCQCGRVCSETTNLQINNNFRQLSGGGNFNGNLFVAFWRAASGQHAATPGGRPRVEASRAPPVRHTPTHHSCCGIGSGPTGEKPHVSRCVLSSFDQSWLLLPAILGLGTASSRAHARALR